MKKFWIVIADAGRAVVMGKQEGDDHLVVVHGLDNPAGRLHTSELVEDQRGRLEKKVGRTRSATEPPTNPHEQEVLNFVHRIQRLIEDAIKKHEFNELILIAPPHFLGLLRSGLSGAVCKSLMLCQGKDFAHATLEELDQHVRALLLQPEQVGLK